MTGQIVGFIPAGWGQHEAEITNVHTNVTEAFFSFCDSLLRQNHRSKACSEVLAESLTAKRFNQKVSDVLLSFCRNNVL